MTGPYPVCGLLTHFHSQGDTTNVAVKIRLKRLGKIRVPQYRIVIVDSRKKRDGRVIEEIGKYHPKEEPSLIDVVSDRAQYWLGVGAQPTEAVEAILKVTGDWQKFKGLPGAEGTLKVKEPKRDKLDIFNEALKDAASEPKAAATTKKAPKKVEAPAETAPAADKAPTKKAATDKAATDKAPTKKAATEKAATDKAATEEAPTKKAATDKAATEEAATEEAATEKAATEKAATEKAPTEEAPTEKAPTEEAPAEPSAEAVEADAAATEAETAPVPASQTPEGAAAEAEAAETVTAEDLGKSEA